LPDACPRSLLSARVTGLAILAAGAAGVILAGFHGGRLGATTALVGFWLVWMIRDRRQARRWASPARRDNGVVFFAEAARWLCIRWGFARVARGLDAGGLKASIELFRWSPGWRGFLAIPALMSHGMMRTRARRLAEKIARYQRQYPDRPVDLIGYSSGAYVVIAALESLAPGVKVRTVILLAPTVRPGYDLAPALGHVGRHLACVHSRGDWLINGIGPLLFGTADRHHGLAAGTVGFRPVEPAGLGHRLVDVPHTWAFCRSGYFGDHFTVAGSGFARDHVAGWLVKGLEGGKDRRSPL
jgi:hypothetical protein